MRGVLLVAVVALTLIPASGAAAASKEHVTTPVAKQAWYAQAPPCAALDCSIVPLVSPYPEDTLHVAVSAGQETARTYLSFPLLVPQDGRLVGGELRLPVDADPTHGGVTPESADMIACLTTSKFKPVRGSFDKPPATNCRLKRSARFDEKKQRFTVDLQPFAEKWKRGKAALALVPSKDARESQQTWHVVFPANPGEKEEEGTQQTPEILATLTYKILGEGEPVGPTFETDTAPPAPDQPPPNLGAGAPPSFDSAAPDTTSTVDLGQASTPTEVTPQSTTPVSNFIEGFAGPGFAYPIVWALPLVLLAGFAALGRALTKQLYRRDL